MCFLREGGREEGREGRREGEGGIVHLGGVFPSGGREGGREGGKERVRRE